MRANCEEGITAACSAWCPRYERTTPLRGLRSERGAPATVFAKVVILPLIRLRACPVVLWSEQAGFVLFGMTASPNWKISRGNAALPGQKVVEVW